MLKRLYVHNYKCLVNFEINFDQDISLFLGANGSGKSTVFEVLGKLRRVIFYKIEFDGKSKGLASEKIDNIFDYSDKPRWLKDEVSDTHFELDIEINNYVYKYILTVDLGCIKQDLTIPSKITKESLYCDKDILVESKAEKTIYFDKHIGETEYAFDREVSSIARYCEFCAKDFLYYFRSLFLVRINPYEMNIGFVYQNNNIKKDLSNLAQWLSHLNEENRKGIFEFEKAMRNILPGYICFKINSIEHFKVLRIDFKNVTDEKKVISYDFEELSEGQKVLFALYALLYCTPYNSLICIDEPENFLALPEIQPWFDVLYDQCAERNLQALLISHHPKIINLLANDSGYWFSRENNLTRVQKISPEEETGLSVADLIERGWIYEQ